MKVRATVNVDVECPVCTSDDIEPTAMQGGGVIDVVCNFCGYEMEINVHTDNMKITHVKFIMDNTLKGEIDASRN